MSKKVIRKLFNERDKATNIELHLAERVLTYNNLLKLVQKRAITLEESCRISEMMESEDLENFTVAKEIINQKVKEYNSKQKKS